MTEPFIRVQGLRKTYHMGRIAVHALNNVNLEIPTNSFLVVMGPSGSGKSTLLHLMGGLDRPSEGHIEVGGNFLEKMDENELAIFRRREIGFIFQSFNLISSMSAMENVLFPCVFPATRAASAASDRWKCCAGLAWKTAPCTAPRSYPAGSNSAWRLLAP